MDPNATGYPALQLLQAQQQQQQQQQHNNNNNNNNNNNKNNNTGYPVTTQGQQYPFYPNVLPSSFPQSKTPSQQQQQHQQQQQQQLQQQQQQHHHQQQQQQQHSYGPVSLQSGGPGGAMMPSGFPQQSSGPGPHGNFPAAFTQPHIPTTLAQFIPSQGTPTTSNMPTTAAQAFSRNMASISANSMLPGQQPRPVPPANQLPGSIQAAGQSPAAAREKARVSTLLDINSMLLQEVVNLQAAGKAGGPPAQQGSQENNPSPTSDQASDAAAKGPTQKPSPEYIECMRRLQANLAYLATIADRAKKSGGVAPAAPAIMTPPPNMPSINELYGKLNDLFRTSKGVVGTPQPSPQGTPGNGKPSPSPAAEMVV